MALTLKLITERLMYLILNLGIAATAVLNIDATLFNANQYFATIRDKEPKADFNPWMNKILILRLLWWAASLVASGIILCLNSPYRALLASNLLCCIPVVVGYMISPIPTNLSGFHENIFIRITLFVTCFLLTHIKASNIILPNRQVYFYKVKSSFLFATFVLFFIHGIYPIHSTFYFFCAGQALAPKLEAIADQITKLVRWKDVQNFDGVVTLIFGYRMIRILYIGCCSNCWELGDFENFTSCLLTKGIVNILDIFFLTRLSTITTYCIGRLVNFIVIGDFEVDLDSAEVNLRFHGHSKFRFYVFLCSGIMMSFGDSEATLNSIKRSAMLIGSTLLLHGNFRMASSLRSFTAFRAQQVRATILGLVLLVISIIGIGRFAPPIFQDCKILWTFALIVILSIFLFPELLVVSLLGHWLTTDAESFIANTDLANILVVVHLVRFSLTIFFTLFTLCLKLYENRQQYPQDKKLTIEEVILNVELYAVRVEIMYGEIMAALIFFNSKDNLFYEPVSTIIWMFILLRLLVYSAWKVKVKGAELTAKQNSWEKVNSFPNASEEEIKRRRGDVCPICHIEMSSAKMISCGHVYHSWCLRMLFDSATLVNPITKCPLCQAILITPPIVQQMIGTGYQVLINFLIYITTKKIFQLLL